MNQNNKQERIEVICDNLSSNPLCPHGPTTLIQKYLPNSEIPTEFYTCSAYRSSVGCKFYCEKSNYKKNILAKRSHKILLEEINKRKELRRSVLKELPEHRCYCHTCSNVYPISKKELHLNHDVVEGIQMDLFTRPTNLIKPLNNDKGEAQYFFNESTLHFLGDTIRKLGYTKVACIGAPRLHEYLNSKTKIWGIKSILLDLDDRFLCFFDDSEFAVYNMLNNHFFEGSVKQTMFEQFLTISEEEQVLIVCDPPFGCRTELLSNTLQEIGKTYRTLNNYRYPIIPVFWIFPYYMENYIKKFKPEMVMLDYKISYTNHDKYHNGKSGRKQGSPVRLFTNIPIDSIKLPKPEGYKFCRICNRWTYLQNEHCKICDECPSKNGEKYRHCKLCAICVKPRYVHCSDCNMCTQKENHFCSEIQGKLYCNLCKIKGHTMTKCKRFLKFTEQSRKHRGILVLMKAANKKGYKICCICCKTGHNETKCPKRSVILKESYFMNSCTNILNRESVQ